MSKGNKWYYNLSWLVRLLLAILPPVAWIVHSVARITSGKLIGLVTGLLFLFLFLGLIFWIIDLVCTILHMRLFFT